MKKTVKAVCEITEIDEEKFLVIEIDDIRTEFDVGYVTINKENEFRLFPIGIKAPLIGDTAIR